MKLSTITSYLEQVAPLRFQESYDNAGLITGDPEMDITGIMVSLDATEEVIDDAIAKGCNLVVSHHPIVFRGIKKFNSNYYVDKAVIKAIKNDIALYAIHTNLDNVLQDGVNQRISKKLELTDVSILRPHPSAHLETSYMVGAGAIGFLKQKMTAKEFIQYVKVKMNLTIVRHTKELAGTIQKVAFCGGAGSFLLDQAIATGADAFITADYKYHEFFDANGEIIILDIGHYESEYYTIELILELISKKFPNFAAHYTKVVTNPVYYS